MSVKLTAIIKQKIIQIKVVNIRYNNKKKNSNLKLKFQIISAKCMYVCINIYIHFFFLRKEWMISKVEKLKQANTLQCSKRKPVNTTILHFDR